MYTNSKINEIMNIHSVETEQWSNYLKWIFKINNFKSKTISYIQLNISNLEHLFYQENVIDAVHLKENNFDD